ncbi:MAG: VTT domain-containing protein [Bacteroidetes bacterium]|nr:VTT domain-containing protein [Bacteroidota bacterium]
MNVETGRNVRGLRSLRISLFVLLIAGLVTVTILSVPRIEIMTAHPMDFAMRTARWVRSFGLWGAVIYMLLQVMQVVIAPIPGEMIQMAGGYIYGTFLGAIYTEIGIVAGVVIVFSFVRLTGYPAVRTFFSEEKLRRFDFLINNQKSEILLFLLFLIPGIPKDMLTYVAGLTPIKSSRFFLITSIARFPGILGSVYMGAQFGRRDYVPVIIVGVVAVTLFAAGLVLQRPLVDFIDRISKE